MLRLCSRITITNSKKEVFTLDSVKSVEATTSWDSLVDTATVEFPKNIFVRKNNTTHMVSLAERVIVSKDLTKTAENSDNPLFSVNNKIKIELGYDFNYNVVLEGIITGVSPTVPIVLECADPMWLLGKIKLEKEANEDIEKTPPTLEGLLDFLTSEFKLNKEIQDLSKTWEELKGLKFTSKTENFPLANFSVKNKTILQVLDELKKVYHLYSYYKTDSKGNNTVSCGDYYLATEGGKVKKFNFQNNVISEELVDKKKESVKIKVTATNIEDKGSSGANTTIDVGSLEKGAKTIYLHYYKLGNSNTSEILKSIALRKLNTVSYDGYSGHFTTFGKPFVEHGETVKLIDNYVKDRNGFFKVRQVDYSFGDTGFRQKIHLHLMDENPPLD